MIGPSTLPLRALAHKLFICHSCGNDAIKWILRSTLEVNSVFFGCFGFYPLCNMIRDECNREKLKLAPVEDRIGDK